MLWVVRDRETNKVSWIGDRIPRYGIEYTDRGEPIPIPDQPVWHGDATEETPPKGFVYVGMSYDDVPLKFSSEEIQEIRKATIDLSTANAINSQAHPFTPIEEQIGILREQIVQILNALGIEPTPEFAHLNEVAIQAIEEARKLKEGLYAENNSTS